MNKRKVLNELKHTGKICKFPLGRSPALQTGTALEGGDIGKMDEVGGWSKTPW